MFITFVVLNNYNSLNQNTMNTENVKEYNNGEITVVWRQSAVFMQENV